MQKRQVKTLSLKFTGPTRRKSLYTYLVVIYHEDNYNSVTAQMDVHAKIV